MVFQNKLYEPVALNKIFYSVIESPYSGLKNSSGLPEEVPCVLLLEHLSNIPISSCERIKSYWVNHNCSKHSGFNFLHKISYVPTSHDLVLVCCIKIITFHIHYVVGMI